MANIILEMNQSEIKKAILPIKWKDGFLFFTD